MNPDKRNRLPGSSANKKRKFGRAKVKRTCFKKKKKVQSQQPLNPEPTSSEVPTSRSRQKLKLKYLEASPVQNRIFDISLLFPGLQEFLSCKSCGGAVRFTEIDVRGLGTTISITCSLCNKATFIESSRKVGFKKNGYEINRRVVLAARSLGHGHAGLSTFCGIMDLLSPISHSNFDIINSELKVASKTVAEESMRVAMEENCSSETQEDDHQTVSGDGSWRKRGHSSLQGVSTLIRHANGKVIDVSPKQSFCTACNKHPEKDTAEYSEWFEAHQEKCSANHNGNSGKMEVDGIVEMFCRSETIHGVKYLNYIGDGDSKVYKALCDANPYEDLAIKKKECVGHVQKRMGTRLRNLKKNLAGQKLSDGVGIGGKNRLTAQRIDQLTRYYGNAIRGHNHSVEAMSNAIWATFFHKKSTDKEPRHELCPEGRTSWCKWQVAKAKGTLKTFQHKDNIPAAVMDAVQPIYEDLTDQDLLERCIGGYTQNNNESFNQSIWKLVPKHSFSGLAVLEIGVYLAVTSFNDGRSGVLQVMHKFGVRPGPSAVTWAKNTDNYRLFLSDKKTSESSHEARQARKRKNHADDDFYQAGAF